MAAAPLAGVGLSPSPAAALAAFTESVAAAGEEALAATETTELRLEIAHVTVRLRVAGAPLAAPLLPALAPLAVSSTAAPALDVTVFDTAASGVRLPPPPWPPGAYRPGDRIEGFGDDDHAVAYALDPGVLSLVDIPGGRAFFWTRDAVDLPRWETGAPLRTLLRLALRGRGLQLVHGAVVGDERGGVLLAGVGGSGKSTTALACALAGLGFVGDDYCVLEPASPPRAHALYAFGKTGPASLRLLPELGGALVPGGPTPEGKELVDVGAARPGALRHTMRLAAIVLPRVAAATGAPVRITPAEALMAIAPTTLLQLPGSGPADLSAMAELSRGLPAYRLDVGPEPDEVVAAVRAVLECHS